MPTSTSIAPSTLVAFPCCCARNPLAPASSICISPDCTCRTVLPWPSAWAKPGFCQRRFCDRQAARRQARAFFCRPGPKIRPTKEGAMTTTKSQNVQDVFLNNVRKNKTPVTVYLISGVKLQGIITWFDNFSVLLRRDAHSQLVYKHAISTVMPATPIQLFEAGKDEEQE